jgi:hypothetical protein
MSQQSRQTSLPRPPDRRRACCGGWPRAQQPRQRMPALPSAPPPSSRQVPILPREVAVKGGACAIAAGDAPLGAPLTVTSLGDRMPGVRGPPGELLQARSRGVRDGGDRQRAGAGLTALRQRPAPVRCRARGAGQAAAHQRRAPRSTLSRRRASRPVLSLPLRGFALMLRALPRSVAWRARRACP